MDWLRSHRASETTLYSRGQLRGSSSIVAPIGTPASLAGHRKSERQGWLLRMGTMGVLRAGMHNGSQCLQPPQAQFVASQIVTFVYRSHWVQRSFLKPIWLAYSLKHLLQIMSSYFLMRPSWLVHTRQARESFPYFLGWECCWWGIFSTGCLFPRPFIY